MDTIAREASHETVVQRSRFIALSLRVDDGEPGFLSRLGTIRAQYPDATHHVYAYILQEPDGQIRTRCVDDGEPRHSAGKPVLAPIQGRELVNTAVIVVRYFGGIKLGVGGLVRAYGHAAADVLEASGRIPLTHRTRYSRVVPYPDLREAERAILAAGGHITARAFGAAVTIEYETETVRGDSPD